MDILVNKFPFNISSNGSWYFNHDNKEICLSPLRIEQILKLTNISISNNTVILEKEINIKLNKAFKVMGVSLSNSQ